MPVISHKNSTLRKCIVRQDMSGCRAQGAPLGTRWYGITGSWRGSHRSAPGDGPDCVKLPDVDGRVAAINANGRRQMESTRTSRSSVCRGRRFGGRSSG